MEVKRTHCEMCNPRCKILVHVENGRLVKTETDRSWPMWDAIRPPTSACVRQLAIKDIMYHPDRVNFPLKRVGERGEGKWERISWEQAFDEIAEKLSKIRDKYGAEALGVIWGFLGYPAHWAINRFLNLFGSPNNFSPTPICHGPTACVARPMMGWLPKHRTYMTIEKDGKGEMPTKCIMLMGINPPHSRFRLWKTIPDAQKMGTKLIVIDPRRTETAEIADLHLQIRPATDVPLLMSMINVIIEEGLYDKEFVEKWCYGFDKLRERAKEFPLEKAAEITWVPADKIREAALMLGRNRPAITMHGMGTEESNNATYTVQAEFILKALLGSIDVEGGEYVTGPGRCITDGEMELSEKLSPEQKRKQLGADRFRLIGFPGFDAIMPHVKRVWGRPCSLQAFTAVAHLPTGMGAILTGEPYPVKAVICASHNALFTDPNVKLVYKALKSLELFVVIDRSMTPTAQLADYVLASTIWPESPHFINWWGIDDGLIAGEQALPKTIPGEYDHRTEYDCWRELGIRLGQEEYWPWKNVEEAIDYQLSPVGVTLKEFVDKGGYDSPPRKYKKYEQIGFGTPTGKFELYSTIFEQLGYDPLPHHEEPYESPISQPELAKEFPLVLTTGGRVREYYHTDYRQIDSIRRKHPYPLVEINPETAEKLGIADGDWVWIESPRGKIRQKAKLAGIHPRVVHCEAFWWLPELPSEEPWLGGAWESNANVLTNDDPDACDKLCGCWPLKVTLCKVYKCKTY